MWGRRAVFAAMAAVGATAILAAGAPALARDHGHPAAVSVAPEAVGFDSARLRRLDEAMAKVVADGRVAGMTTLLARHGKVVAFHTYGKASLATGAPMSRDAIFRIYSMSKPVTGVAMMILFEEGKWNLDDPVSKYVPAFKDLKVMRGVGPDGQPILEPLERQPTMRELMSHTAGFGYGLSAANPVDKLFGDRMVMRSASLQEVVDKVAAIPLLAQPGERWSYSIAVDIQGYIVEKLSGQPLGEFMRQRIFQPLGMTDTGFYAPAGKSDRLASVYFRDPRSGALVETKALSGHDLPTYKEAPPVEFGGAGLVSTTRDYARFAQILANGGALDGVRILSPATLALMGTNMIPQAALAPDADGEFNRARGFGLDLAVMTDPGLAGGLEGKGTLSWRGAAGTWFWADPANDVVFVGMIQRFGADEEGLDRLSRTLVYQALVDPSR